MKISALLLAGLCWLGASTLPAQPDVADPPGAVGALERHFEQVIANATPSVVKVIATAPLAKAWKDRKAAATGKQRKARAADAPRSISVSGLIIDGAGHIAVPAEPFADGVAVFVTVQSEPGRYRQFRARLVGCDRARNVAVIRLLFPTPDLRPIRVGDAGRLRPGSLVLGLGWPYRFPVSCSNGVVGGVNREIWIGGRRLAGLIMTTATVHPGESGGALIDSRGQVVGMLMSALDPTGEARRGEGEGSKRAGAARRVPGPVSASISFAVPIERVLVAAKAIRARHPVAEAPAVEAARFLGVLGSYMLEPNPLTTQLGLPERTGFVVAQVFEGEAAQRGGIREHDVILEIGSVAIQGTGYSILTALEKTPLGRDIPVVVMRKGRKLNLSVRFEPGTAPTPRNKK